MKLLTEEILQKFKEQGDTSEMLPEDIKIIAKYFTPDGSATWYMYEYNPKTKVFFGYANLGIPEFAECGTIALKELESVRGVFGLSVERDRYYGYKHTLKEVIDATEAMI